MTDSAWREVAINRLVAPDDGAGPARVVSHHSFWSFSLFSVDPPTTAAKAKPAGAIAGLVREEAASVPGFGKRMLHGRRVRARVLPRTEPQENHPSTPQTTERTRFFRLCS